LLAEKAGKQNFLDTLCSSG